MCESSLLPDELIRQVSVSCVERGLLLVRVRDEIRMTFAAYQNVLESAIAYGKLQLIVFNFRILKKKLCVDSDYFLAPKKIQ